MSNRKKQLGFLQFNPPFLSADLFFGIATLFSNADVLFLDTNALLFNTNTLSSDANTSSPNTYALFLNICLFQGIGTLFFDIFLSIYILFLANCLLLSTLSIPFYVLRSTFV